MPNVDPQIERSWTLPSRVYTDPELYEASKEAVFAPSWQFLGHEEQAKVPGAVSPQIFLEGCLDEPVVLTRDMGDQLHLLSNVCTHRGMLVCEGASNERYLRCRYHGRRFGLDGSFQSMPDFGDVCDFPTEKDHLPKLSLDKLGPFLFGSLNPGCSFEEFLGPLRQRLGWLPLNEFRLEPSQCRDYMVKAHWALYVDNYLEGFHIPFIHASLTQAIDSDNYLYELHPTGNLQLAMGKDGDVCFDLPKDSPDYGQRIAAYYFWYFPNLMLNFYPWGLSINVVKPLGPALTRVSFIRYVWKDNLVETGAGAGLDRVEREDEAVVEAVQKGVRSRFYDQGRFSPKKEVGTHHFHQLLGLKLGL